MQLITRSITEGQELSRDAGAAGWSSQHRFLQGFHSEMNSRCTERGEDRLGGVERNPPEGKRKPSTSTLNSCGRDRPKRTRNVGNPKAKGKTPVISMNATKRQQQPEEMYLNMTKDSDPEKTRKCRWGRTFRAQDAEDSVHPSPGFWVHLQTLGCHRGAHGTPKTV